jgi:hypothetical protein
MISGMALLLLWSIKEELGGLHSSAQQRSPNTYAHLSSVRIANMSRYTTPNSGRQWKKRQGKRSPSAQYVDMGRRNWEQETNEHRNGHMRRVRSHNIYRW